MVKKHKIPVEEWDGPLKKKGRRLCSVAECTNYELGGGVCRRHGAKDYHKTCSHEGCNNLVQRGGVCMSHGAKVRTCSHEGCTNHVVQGGVCVRHGAKLKKCSHEGCTNIVVKGGVCIRHGAKRYVYTCSHEGCTNNSKRGGVCWRHGAKAKLCSYDGCANVAQKAKNISSKKTTCSMMGVETKSGRSEGSVIPMHGADNSKKTCLTNVDAIGEYRHLCSHEGCTNIAQIRGVRPQR